MFNKIPKNNLLKDDAQEIGVPMNKNQRQKKNNKKQNGAKSMYNKNTVMLWIKIL